MSETTVAAVADTAVATVAFVLFESVVATVAVLLFETAVADTTAATVAFSFLFYIVFCLRITMIRCILLLLG